MHPSKQILGSKGTGLKGRKIVLGICGSVAASLSPAVARELMRRGAEVRAVMTPSACKLISPQLMHWATGGPVVCELTGEVEHIQLAEWADLLLIAPATANTLSKIACGIDDTPVTSVASAMLGRKPLLLVPAMHASMYQNPAVCENLKKLQGMGVHLMVPKIEEEKAKFPRPEEIADEVERLLGPKDMQGLRVIVTAGPTIERIDPIKIITNRSSGKMGIALAEVARRRGAEVVLIYGPGTEPAPSGVKVVRVETTEEMRRAVESEARQGADMVFFAAAPQDLMPERRFERKLRSGEVVEVRLVPAPRVSGEVRGLLPQAVLVAFKAEYGVGEEELLLAGRRKLAEGFDLVVANDVSKEGLGFGSDWNEILLVGASGERRLRGRKTELAEAIVEEALRLRK
ncbi:MAG: bifunctional phosphopantothenoylcysteine decarboxylase/phosphopantothenate--cysteine ligase CoaBC [Candidatus Hadarchaeales archaeon]